MRHSTWLCCVYLYWLSQMRNISALSSWCFFTTKLHLVISLSLLTVYYSKDQLHKDVSYYANYIGYHMKIRLQENSSFLKYIWRQGLTFSKKALPITVNSDELAQVDSILSCLSDEQIQSPCKTIIEMPFNNEYIEY